MRKGVVHSQTENYFLVAERRWLTERRADMRLVSKWGPCPKKPSGHRSKQGFSVAFSKALQASFQPLRAANQKGPIEATSWGRPSIKVCKEVMRRYTVSGMERNVLEPRTVDGWGKGEREMGGPLTVHLSSKRVHPEPKGQEDRR